MVGNLLHTNAAVRNVLISAEAVFRKCFSILLRVNESNLLKFQPTLAEALFRIDKVHLALAQRRQQLILRKKLLDEKWFLVEMRRTARAQESLKEAISIGHALGDAFAWIFYRNSRTLLDRHLSSPPQPFRPTGIGGQGELEFIRRGQLLNDFFVLYHGITSLLRVGDASLINPKTMKAVGLCEIKTERTSESTLNVMLFMVGSEDFTDRLFTTGKMESPEEPKEFLETFPDRKKQHLDRQIKTMAKSFEAHRIDKHISLSHHGHVNRLGELMKQLQSKRSACIRVHEGLVLFGMKAPGKSLSQRLFGPKRSFSSQKLFTGLVEKVALTIDRSQIKSPDNSNCIIINAISMTNSLRGMESKLLWPLKSQYIRALLLGEIIIFSIYNPAHLIRRLRDRGFNVTVSKCGRAGPNIEVEKHSDKHIFRLIHGSYLLTLVHTYLHSEDLIVDVLSRAMAELPKMSDGQSATIQLVMQQHLEAYQEGGDGT
ncbi:MAG: hypothetical protein RDU59_12265 [Thermodesulfobacteriota bacterium]|nr:hypothetical protein [Thermodesulfobacteriota bacterium]